MNRKKNAVLSLFVLGGCLLSQASSASQGEGEQNISTLFNRIVGGVKAEKGEFPFIVSLQTSTGDHFCGGSLIQSGWVLTAAHCVKGTVAASKLKLVIGLYQQSNPVSAETFKAKKVLIHPEYQSKTDTDFDYALIQLSGNSKFSPVLVNSVEIDIPEVENGSPLATTAGWGTTQPGGEISDTLMKVNVPLVSAKRCESAYPREITDRMICAGYDRGGKDSCQGDSGGPLILNSAKGQKTLIGLVSWGEGCAQPKKFGVYSKVNFASSWIESTMRAN